MLKIAGVHSFELSVIFLSGHQMRALNRKFLGHDYVTDVITFNFMEDSRPLPRMNKSRREKQVFLIEGEIYVCPAEARRNARSYGEPYERELLRYIAHGILHLLGYDDATKTQRSEMRAEEDRLII